MPVAVWRDLMAAALSRPRVRPVAARHRRRAARLQVRARPARPRRRRRRRCWTPRARRCRDRLGPSVRSPTRCSTRGICSTRTVRRPSKNQSRWQFGVLGPPGAADAGLGEDDTPVGAVPRSRRLDADLGGAVPAPAAPPGRTRTPAGELSARGRTRHPGRVVDDLGRGRGGRIRFRPGGFRRRVAVVDADHRRRGHRHRRPRRRPPGARTPSISPPNWRSGRRPTVWWTG